MDTHGIEQLHINSQEFFFPYQLLDHYAVLLKNNSTINFSLKLRKEYFTFQIAVCMAAPSFQGARS